MSADDDHHYWSSASENGDRDDQGDKMELDVATDAEKTMRDVATDTEKNILEVSVTEALQEQHNMDQYIVNMLETEALRQDNTHDTSVINAPHQHNTQDTSTVDALQQHDTDSEASQDSDSDMSGSLSDIPEVDFSTAPPPSDPVQLAIWVAEQIKKLPQPGMNQSTSLDASSSAMQQSGANQSTTLDASSSVMQQSGANQSTTLDATSSAMQQSGANQSTTLDASSSVIDQPAMAGNNSNDETPQAATMTKNQRRKEAARKRKAIWRENHPEESELLLSSHELLSLATTDTVTQDSLIDLRNRVKSKAREKFGAGASDEKATWIEAQFNLRRERQLAKQQQQQTQGVGGGNAGALVHAGPGSSLVPTTVTNSGGETNNIDPLLSNPWFSDGVATNNNGNVGPANGFESTTVQGTTGPSPFTGGMRTMGANPGLMLAEEEEEEDEDEGMGENEFGFGFGTGATTAGNTTTTEANRAPSPSGRSAAFETLMGQVNTGGPSSRADRETTNAAIASLLGLDPEVMRSINAETARMRAAAPPMTEKEKELMGSLGFPPGHPRHKKFNPDPENKM